MNERDIFIAALQRPTEQRSAFLDQACAADAELRRRVEVLLKAHDEAGSFLQGSTSAADDPSAAATLDTTSQPFDANGIPVAQPRGTGDRNTLAEKPGTIIGRYKLLQQIGEGGFGVVYMAEQEEPVKRRVALKIIKAGMDTGQVIARFEAERQALAMMDHPNIARVLDAGATDAGRPFFVMELVKGIPITQYCDEANLDTRQRLALFKDVCSAVQHAHQKGVIHRDLKPSNIMVTLHDGKPVVKVIDFGIAKATDQKLTEKTLFTNYGQMIGTPTYMSPEQAVMSGLDVDTRSDVYSLGVLLYELLTGGPPFDAETLRTAGYDEMRRIIREQEPPKPSTRLSTLAAEVKLTVAAKRHVSAATLSKQLHGDLDWIVMKALEKDRARRYESASAFAQDIDRHLGAEPVHAAAPSTAYRFGKFARRNKGPMTVAAVIALLLMGGIFTSSLLAIRATRAEADAVNEAGRAVKAEKLAEERLAQVEAEKVNVESEKQKVEQEKQIANAVKDFLQNKLLLQADATIQAYTLLNAGGSSSVVKPNPNPTIRELLDRAAQELSEEKIEQSFPGQRRLQAEILATVGMAYRGVGEYDEMIAFLTRAHSLLEAELGPDHPATHDSMRRLAEGYRYGGMLQQALPLYEKSLNLSREIYGSDHQSTFLCMNGLAVAYRLAGQLDLAIPLFKETLKLQKEKFGLNHPATLTVMNNLAGAYEDAGQLDLALPLYEETVKRSKELLGPQHPATLTSINNLALAYQHDDRLDLALSLLEEVLELTKENRGPDHPRTLASMNNLATGYLRAGKLDLALPLAKQALKLSKEKLGSDHPVTLTGMHNLAGFYEADGKLELARSLLEETIELAKEKLGPDHPDTLSSEHNLAWLYYKLGKLDLALPLFEQTLQRLKEKLGPDHPKTLSTMNNLCTAYQAAGKLDLALPLFEETLKLRTAKLGRDHSATLLTMSNFASAYQVAGKLNLALPLFEETLKLRTAKLGRDHPLTLDSMNRLAAAYQDAGKLDLALPLFEETLKLRTAKFGPDHLDTLNTMYVLALAYQEADKLDLALPLFEETLKLRTAKFGPDHLDTLNARYVLARGYKATDKLDQALALFEDTFKLMKEKLGADDRNTLRCMRSLALLYRQVGRTADELPLLEELLTRGKSALGPHDRATLMSMHDLAWSYCRDSRLEDGLRLYEEALELYRTHLGDEDDDTRALMRNLLATYRNAGQCEKALTLWRIQSSREPENTSLTLKVAALQAWFGLDKEIATTADGALIFAADTLDPVVADRTAKACCLRPSDDKARIAAALKLARFAVKQGHDHKYLMYFQMALGMAEYRSGNYAAADEALLAVEQKYKKHRHLGCTSSFYRAMSLYRQGKPDEARELAAATAAQMKPLPADEKNPLAGNASADDLIVWLAYKEAKALIAFDRALSPRPVKSE